MRHKALIGTIAMLGFIALAGLFAALSFSLSSPSPAYAQTNNAPSFTDGETTTRSVDENSPSFHDIGAPVTATDDDTRLVYTLENAHTSPFTIVRATGQLQVGQPLDYETQNSYSVTVVVTDREGAKDTITVTITVNNVEESESVSLSWKQPQVGATITASLSELDGINSGPTWQWAKANTKAGPYSNLSGNAAEPHTYTPQPDDDGKWLRATATYTDGQGASKTAHAVSSKAVRPSLLSNTAPAFYESLNTSYSCDDDDPKTFCMHARKSSPVGESIYYPVRATDDDTGDEVRYSLEGTGSEHFSIVPSTGVLLTKTLPRELTDSSYTFKIKASDQSGDSDTITVKITPSGSGDAPVVKGPSRITYPENGTWPLATYSGTNANGETHGWIIAVQPGGGDGDFFRMNDEGMLLFEQPPDYEDPADDNGDNTYSFSIMAYDTNPLPGKRPGQSFFSVSVTVTDVSGEVSEISGPSVVDYAENRTDAVATYAFTLQGVTAPAEWSLSGADGGEFDISATGELTFKRSPDYEAPTDAAGENAYLVTITAYKGSESKTEFVRVRVTDVNEPPEFDEGNTATRSVDRSASVNQVFGALVKATDPDGDVLTYTLESAQLYPFDIEPYTGQLYVSEALDDAEPSYTVSVSVSDGRDADGNIDPSADDRITVTINVTGDQNDAPEFPSTETGARAIPENTTGVQNVGVPVAASDADTGDTLTYTLGGTDSGFFTIVEASGQIQTKSGVTYDHETKPTYSVTVTATDTADASDTQNVAITVTNVEEDGTVTLSPTQPAARAQVTATLTDLDQVVSGTTTWQWAKSSTAQGTYANISGATSDSYTPPDADVNYYLRATASYTDGHSANKTAKAETARAVQTGTNRPPTFDDGQITTRQVAEDAAANANVGAVVGATDPDSDSLTYSLTGTDESSFTVDNTGQIKVGTTTTLDHEAVKNSYTVIVQVHDNKNAGGTTDTTIDDTIVVTINVTDVDEAGTVTLSTYQPPARAEITATLADLDGGVTSRTWQWARTTDPTNLNTHPWVNITDATSASYTPVDGDVNYYLQATVSYTDGQGSGKSAKAETTQAVGAGANRAPTFSATPVTLTVAENSAENVNVGSPVTATDLDTGNTLEYSLDTTGATLFDIDSASGQIKTKSGVAYDHETTPSYSVTVKANDGNNGTATKPVAITVTNVEEDGTVTLSPTQPAARSPVTASLTDLDGGVTGTSWQWARSNTQNGSYTNISGATSDSYTPPDADVNYYLRATASYTDGHGANKTAKAETARAVQTGTNRPPTFDDGQITTRQVAEDAAANANVGAVVGATDPDSDSLTYSLTGTDESSFTVDNTGQIKVGTTTTLDHEAVKNSYTVIVQVHDNKNAGGTTDTTIDDTIVVTINVTDVDEAGTVTLSTYQPPARAEITATLADLDGGVTSRTWQWARTTDPTNLNTHPWVNITDATSASYTPVDGDVNYYLQATVSYTDGQGSGKSAKAETTQAVGAGANRAPTFSATPVTLTVAENSAENVNVGSPVTATDLDTGNTLEYSLDTTGATLFDIDSASGQIKTKSGVAYDHETTPSYSVTVKANDGNNGTATKPVAITVTNVEEDGTVTLSMTQPSARTEITATLTDPDGGVTGTTWVWARSDAQDGTYTGINGETSATYTPDDADVGKFLKATATYEDSRGSGKTAEGVSDNAVGSGANRAPEFPDTTATREVAENTGVGVAVGPPVEADDDDTTDTLTYTLEGTDKESFQIVPTSGQIQTKQGVTYNHEAKATYSVTVKVDDGNNSTDTIAVTINVADVNEKPQFQATESGKRTIAENTPTNTNIGAPVGATDPDDGQTLTYVLSGKHAEYLRIDSSSGQLKTSDPLDHEAQDTLYVTVEVRDSRDANGDADASTDDRQKVEITVTNVNEPPEFPSTENGVRNVVENTVAGQDIGVPVAALDPDKNASLTYTLGGTDAASFNFNTSTGQLKTKAALDKETKDTYTVTVLVHDGYPDNTVDDTITVTINVTDSNEPPVLTGQSTVNYPENGYAPVHTYTATDPEGAKIDWSLKGDDASEFSIDGGVLAFEEPPNYEVPSDSDTDKEYSVTVVATDGKNPVEHPVTVTLTDVNDPPSFDPDAVDRTVNENTQPGGHVGLAVSADDEDAGDTLTYSLGGEDSASFGINSSTGQITVGTGTRLDSETRTSYEVTVTATDPSYTSATITVTITVGNVDEAGTVTLSQSQPQVDTPLTATLNDPDGAVVSTTTWKWEISPDETNWTTITDATLASYTPVSGDLGKFLRVTASYTDGHGPGKSAQAVPDDPVRDVPATNEAPEFPSTENGARSVAENTAAGENVGAAVAADDGDSGDTLTYKLGGVDSPYFTIVDNSGQIQTKAPLDYEAKSTYTVTVTATDPSRESDTVTVTITVTDANEPPLQPSIPAMTQNSRTSLTMAWTAPSSTGRPAVTDYDYRYKKTTETSWTEVTNTPITLTSVEITGLEATTYYHVQVRATNAEGTGDWSASGIGITRTLPNNKPEFPTPTTTREVAETAQERQNIGDPVDAQDTDKDDLTYILEGFDADSFMIDDSTGQLKTKMPLDYETKSAYSVMVKAEDGRGGSDSIGVNINVIDVNEPPVFSGNLGVHSVPENTGPGVDIGAPVTATDQEDDTLTYSLDSAGAHAFAIDASTGQLRTKAVLDYETARTHSVEVHVSDRKDAKGDPDTAVDDTISVTITVTNINEPPAFTEVAPARSIDENSPTGTDVGNPVTATDPESDTLTYTLDGPDAASFDIVAATGQLQTKADLDYESPKTSYRVTVTATDPSGESATVPVTIAVTGVNEPPEVTIRSTVRYAENGTDPVDTYEATDPERGTITWTLSGADMDDFKITKVNNNGVLTFKTPPNFEAPADADSNNVYLVTVQVSDGTNTDQLAVTVTVFNVNEPPAFPGETDSRSVDENTAAGQNLGDAVAATDPERHTLTYKLAGTDGASFDIDTATGQLKTKAPLDFETKITYEVTVHVRDSKDQDDRVNAVTDDTVDITITINNVEELGWVVFSSRQPQIDTAFTATIEDPDGGVTGATWVWENSSNGSTGWNTATGAGATSASYTPVDADSGKYLRVTASYTDGEGSGKSTLRVSDNPVRVHPDPENNIAPTFDSPTATRNIDEGTRTGQNIGAPVAATDSDYDVSFLTYSLTGTDAASFDIHRATGQLLTKEPLDHEEKPTYRVIVTVVDPSLKSDTVTVTITVNDVDEPPVLSGPDVVDYPENGTDAVAQYTATDPEGVTITDWSLEGDDKDLFEISRTGELTFKSPPNHDIAGDNDGNNIYLLTVTASDGTTPVTLDVEVTVSNVNEAPEFPASETGDRTVAENTAADQDIGDPVAATDPDDGDTLTYTLGGADAASFAIEETTGQLKTKDTLNYEAKPNYTVVVTAADTSALSVTITVTVTVTSVNEPPEFTDGATASRSVAENTPADQDIGAVVEAIDPDSGDILTYTLGGDDAASFAIDESTGQLKTRDPLDHETKASYSVTVSASDGKDIDGNNDPSADNTIDVTITVTDLDEDGNVILSSLQPQEGVQLAANLTDPDGPVSNVAWTWASSSTAQGTYVDIAGATSEFYIPTTVDVDSYLQATASYTNANNVPVSAQGVSAHPVRARPASNTDPEFPSSETGDRSIAENTPPGQPVGLPVTATDAEAGDVLTYTLEGTDAASFTIGMASGQLRTKAVLDHETKDTYRVVVRVADPFNTSDTIDVTITVTDVDEKPEISGETSVYYAEDRTDTVATYTATDPENDTITWSLLGDDSEDFTISNTGELTFNTPPDRENPADKDIDNVYLVTVQAFDGTNTVPLDVSVTVIDTAPPSSTETAPGGGNGGGGNGGDSSSSSSRSSSSSSSSGSGGSYSPPVNNPPVFTEEPSAARSVAENTAADRNIGDPVTATDPDKDPLTYALGGTDSASFTVDENSGQLKTKAVLDFESKFTYTVTVTADDGKNGVAAIDVTIDVTDVVEAPINNPETVSQPFTQVPAPLPAAQPVTVAPVVIVNEKGDLGSQGPLGRQGQQGEAGSAGVSGPQGRPGQQGQRGEAGPDGVAGLQGPQGPRGSAGPPGDNGSSGVDGPRGLTGEQGPHGDDASTRTKYIALIVAVVTLPLVLLLWAWDWLRTPNRPRNRRPTGRGPRPTQTGRPAHPHGEGPE